MVVVCHTFSSGRNKYLNFWVSRPEYRIALRGELYQIVRRLAEATGSFGFDRKRRQEPRTFLRHILTGDIVLVEQPSPEMT